MKKIFTLFLAIFLVVGLSSCGNKKQEIKKEVKNNTTKIISTNKKNNEKKDFKLKKFNKDIKKLSFIELNNSLYSNGGGENLKDKIKILSASGETINNKFKATFLESFLGDYNDALNQREKLCKVDSESDYCKDIDLSLVSYRPVDTKGNNLKNIKIYIDGKLKGKLKGNNSFNVKNKFIHRIRLSKEGYLDFYKKIFIDSNNLEKDSLNPKLLKSSLQKIIGTDKNEELKTNNFTFSILSNSFTNLKGQIYKGRVKIYAFDIGKENGNLNVLNLDTFDSSGSYVGNSMVTFGMPLIKVYDLRGNELNISKSIIGKGKIENQDKAPGIDLKNVPKNVWLGRKELDKYKIPSFWYLNQKSGVWIESKMKILDSDGNYEFKLL